MTCVCVWLSTWLCVVSMSSMYTCECVWEGPKYWGIYLPGSPGQPLSSWRMLLKDPQASLVSPSNP